MNDTEPDDKVQPGLFDPKKSFDARNVLLYALGDFQDRGFVLEGRLLALDRLLGALERAYEAFDIARLDDEAVAETLAGLGAKVTKLPGFVAKHPFRVCVERELAAESLEYFRSFKEN